MTEHDSGAGGDSTPDIGSSPDGWSSPESSSTQGGFDVSLLAQTLIDDLTEPGRPDRSLAAGPSEAEQRRRAQFDETLKGIFFSSGPVADERSLIRRIVEAERWYVPTGLRREDLPLLIQLADSLDLEQMLVEPAPGQAAALRSARWYVPASNPKLRPSEPGYGDPTVVVYTHPDRADARDGELTELDGLTLCTRLASRDDYVGIDVNGGGPVGAGDQETRALQLGPSFARGIARGVDPRPGAAPLPARTLAEVVLWLDLAGFPWENREIVPVPRPDDQTAGGSAAEETRLIQIRAGGLSTWRIYETSYKQPDRRGPFLSPVFALARPEALPATLPAPIPHPFVTVYGGHLSPEAALSPAAIDLGEGQTQILCAGRLTHRLYNQSSWLPSGWLVSKLDRLRAARLAGWADELLKLISPGADRLPRSSLQTVDGAAFLRQRPELAHRDWLQEQHRRYTRASTRRFNF